MVLIKRNLLPLPKAPLNLKSSTLFPAEKVRGVVVKRSSPGPYYTLRRDEHGHAAAIERDSRTVLILATGAERNEECAQAIVRALNGEADGG